MEANDQEASQWHLIEDFAARSSTLFLKKLSRNDTSWAEIRTRDKKFGKQAGFYVPRQIREAGYFPELQQRGDKPHIYQAHCPSIWPQTGEIKLDSALRHFSNKGSEAHFTRIPKDLFRGLNPASWLLGGVLKNSGAGPSHWFMVIDSQSADAELLETRLDIGSDFHFGLIAPATLQNAARLEADLSAELIQRISEALKTGSLHALLADYARIPSPEQLSREAQAAYLKEQRLASLDPWKMDAPGDAVMRISRDLEYRIYRQHELKQRAVEIIGVLSRSDDLVTSVVNGFGVLDQIFLSASQQRKSRAGRSFENHIRAMLGAGGVRAEEQAILGGRRPDFVLPDARTVRSKSRGYLDAAILSAKTTLRERWKQITHERFGCAIYLATVDDRVSPQALTDLQSAQITLVVPESLKASKETAYKEDGNVITMKQFFEEEIRKKRPGLLMAVPGASSISGSPSGPARLPGF